MTTPITVKKKRNFFFAPPLSATAPRKGDIAVTSSPAHELAMPSFIVLAATSAPWLQYCLKKRGKKPAITVVAKAELAQSNAAQEISSRVRRQRMCPP